MGDQDVRTMSVGDQLKRMTQQRNSLVKMADEWINAFVPDKDDFTLVGYEDLRTALLGTIEEAQRLITQFDQQVSSLPIQQTLEDQIKAVIGNTYVSEGYNLLYDDKNPDWEEE